MDDDDTAQDTIPGGLMGTLGVIAVMLLVIFAAYYVTRLLGRVTAPSKRGANIRIVESFALSRDKQLVIAEISGEVYLLGLSADGISVLDKGFDLFESDEADTSGGFRAGIGGRISGLFLRKATDAPALSKRDFSDFLSDADKPEAPADSGVDRIDEILGNLSAKIRPEGGDDPPGGEYDGTD